MFFGKIITSWMFDRNHRHERDHIFCPYPGKYRSAKTRILTLLRDTSDNF